MNPDIEIATISAIMKADRLGPAKLIKLYRHLGSVYKILELSSGKLLEQGLSNEAVTSILEIKNTLNVEKELALLKHEEIATIFIDDPDYPSLLKTIHDPPLALFTRGNPQVLQNDCIAVVGTRNMTRYGEEATKQIASHISMHGFTVVSGLAMGVDGTAHQSSLANPGKTIAVMAGGVCRVNIGPKINSLLAEEIIKHDGAIISEYPSLAVTQTYHFPKRNRIIAGISKGVAVMEANIKSGALITANLALGENRDVFALPGPITHATSFGTNFLIQNGATIIVEPADVTRYYLDDKRSKPPLATTVRGVLSDTSRGAGGIQKTNTSKSIMTLNAKQQALIDIIKTEPLPIDIIASKAKIPIHELIASLTDLELKGCLKNNSGVVSSLI